MQKEANMPRGALNVFQEAWRTIPEVYLKKGQEHLTKKVQAGSVC